MRITERQLRQLIREEMIRGMREQDEVDPDEVDPDAAVKMPEPKKGFLSKVGSYLLGEREPSPEAVKWKSEWESLSQGERDFVVGLIKDDPNLPTIAGEAVKEGAFDAARFLKFLELPYPGDGVKVFEGLIGSSGLTQTHDLARRNAARRDLRTKIRNLAFKFKDTADRVYFFRSVGRVKIAGFQPSLFEQFVSENAEMVAFLERIFFEGIKYNESTAMLMRPPYGSKLYKFFEAAGEF